MLMRPVVKRFAEAMEKQLCANDHKGGWAGTEAFELLAHLREEYTELRRAMFPFVSPEAVLREAADVANFAMMIADVFGALGAEEEK